MKSQAMYKSLSPLLSIPQVLWICCCCSVTKSCLALCDPMDCSTPGFPVLHHLLEFAQTYVHWVSSAVQLFHPLLPLSSPALSLSQHQGFWPPDGKSPLVGKDPDAGKDKRAEGKRGNRRWMASLTQQTWVWANSRRWWRTGKPGVLQSPGLQRVRHNLVTDQYQKPTLLTVGCSDLQSTVEIPSGPIPGGS